MERREKCMEKREEGIMVEKLKLVEKRGGRGRSSSSTPPPTWRLVDFPSSQQQQFLNFPTSKTLSARNLCAKLWEFHSHHHEHPPSHQVLFLFCIHFQFFSFFMYNLLMYQFNQDMLHFVQSHVYYMAMTFLVKLFMY